MSDTVKVDLPSGGWWEFKVPKKWRDVRAYGDLLTSEDRESSDEALAVATAAWSFDAEPTKESVQDLDIPDYYAGMRVFNKQVLPLLLGLNPQEMPSESSPE